METQDKKSDILKAASTCFARYGYEKTTLDDIGKLVSLNKASLYYYYKNKESIYTEVIYYEASAFLTGVIAKLEKVEDCKAKILTYIEARLEFMRNAVNLNQLTIDSVKKLAPLFGDMYNKIFEKEVEYLSDVLEQCITHGKIKPCDSRKVARSIITTAEAIKNRMGSCIEVSTDASHQEVMSDVTFTITLMMDGLIIK